MAARKKGFLITIEGIDGAGKSTQVRLLKEWLESRCIKTVALKEPTQGQYGKEISRLAAEHRLPGAEGELRLFMLDRMEDVSKNIMPALESGITVVMDRYYHSNMAYQGAKGLDPSYIEKENERFSPRPDLVLVLDIDPSSGIGRIVEKRNSALDHFEDVEYLKKVREIFLWMTKKPYVAIIDADAPAEVVHSRIVDAIKARLLDH